MAEYRAVRTTYVRLVGAVKLCVEKVAGKAFEKELVTDQTLSIAMNRTQEAEQRASVLVLQVLNMIDLNPAHFNTFVGILESELVLKDMADELKAKLSELNQEISFVVPKPPSPISKTEPLSGNSEFTFPSISLKEISAVERQQLESRLYYESVQISDKFANLYCSTFMSLKEQNISPSDIVNVLVGYSLREPVAANSEQPSFRKQLSKLQRVETVDEIMHILIDYCSFFNFQIIECLIIKFGKDEDKQTLQKYKDEFTEYAKRKVYEMPSKVCHESDNCQALVYVTLDKSFEHFTANELLFFQGKLCEVLQVSPNSLHLCHIKPGSLKLMFQVPSFAEPPIFPLSPVKEAALTKLGVTFLSYSFVYQFSSPSKSVQFQQDDTTKEANKNLKPYMQQLSPASEKQIRKLQEKIAEQEMEMLKLQNKLQSRQIECEEVESANPIKPIGMMLHWRIATSAPRKMTRAVDAILDDDTVYIRPDSTRNVFAYNSTNDSWSQLPDCPTSNCSIAVVNNMLTTIGGVLNWKVTNRLFSLIDHEEDDSKRWEERYPPMPIKRSFFRAVCCETHLIVGDRDSTTIVEVMNTNSLQWSRVADLPHRQSFLYSLVLCEEYLYSVYNDGSVFRCSTSDLIQSTQSKGTEIWSELECTDMLSNSTYVSIRGQLVAVGGRDLDRKPTTAVRMYSPTTKEWEEIGHMKTPRWNCFAAVTSNSSLVVVGGFPTKSMTNKVEIATTV